MTIKDKLLLEIDRLEEVKQTLLKKENFLDPSNSAIVYSTESITRILGVDGATPNNLKEALEKIIIAINSHIKILKDMPSVVREQESVNSISKEYALIEKDNGYINPPVVWKMLERDKPIATFEGYFPNSEFFMAMEKIQFSSGCKFQKNDGSPIDYEIVLRKINLRTADVTKFRGISGNLNVTISGADIDPDDIFIIGVEIHEPLEPSEMYYTDFTYNVRKTKHNGEVDTSVFNIADTRIGNSTMKADSELISRHTVLSATIYWDLIAINDLAVIGTTYNGTDRPSFNNNSMIFSTSAKLDTMLQLSHNGGFINFEEGLYSSYIDTAYFRLLPSDDYTLYSMRTKEKSTLYIPNARPIDVIIREVLDEL